MSPNLVTEAKPLQIAHLRSLMQEADADWEELTRSIQRNQECLTVLRQHLEHFRLVLTLTGEQSPGPASVLVTQGEVLRQQRVRLEQPVILENARRSVIARQFEQARLALAALRRPTHRQGQALFKRLFIWRRKCRFDGCWSALQRSGEWSEMLS